MELARVHTAACRCQGEESGAFVLIGPGVTGVQALLLDILVGFFAARQVRLALSEGPLRTDSLAVNRGRQTVTEIYTEKV